MRTLGRALQYLGLFIPPLLILLGLSGGLNVGWQILAGLVGSVCIFGIGRLLEGYAGS
jgi:hypothetical protein